MTMLCIGVEKLMKITLGLLHVAETGAWPTVQKMKVDYRHDIVKMDSLLRDAIRANLDRATHPVVVLDALEELENDPIWPGLVAALNRYGESGRFFYLDALAESPQKGDSPSQLWDAIERTAVDAIPEVHEAYVRYTDHPDGYNAFNLLVNGAIARSLERFRRAVIAAGLQRVLGERGATWAMDFSFVGQQILDL